MSDYFGNATLEDWLSEEVFGIPKTPTEIVKLFEKWREPIESNIRSWMESDDGDGPASWRGWGRGFYPVENDIEFEECCRKAEKILRGGIENA